MEDKQPIILTPEEQLLILKRWNEENSLPPSITDLIRIIRPNEPNLDGRSLIGIAIKKFLTEKDLKAETKTEYKEKGPIKLTLEQEDFIRNNIATMPRPFELAKEIFQNRRLSPASKEVKAVIEFVKTLPSVVANQDYEGLEAEYKPPKRIEHVVARIRKYVSSTKDWDFNKLTPIQKKNCESLIHYLHDPRFIRQIDNYEKIEDKKTFEGEMIKYCYNKPDLEQEEISQYVSLCSLVVMEFNIKSNIEMLQTMMENEYDELGRAQTNTVESLESARQELNNCMMRQGKLYGDLTEKRSEKLKEKIGQNSSLLTLIETWKIKESRDKIIKMAQERKQKLSEEIDRLETMDDLKVKIMGIGKNEILEG